LQGAVRNLPDGNVRILAEGERQQLEALLAWAEQGPAHAQVFAAEVCWSEARNEYQDFLITG
jgi:acylphosphatase